jgi:Cu(I)/Ag(I) efflux system membrane fusion protein
VTKKVVSVFVRFFVRRFMAVVILVVGFRVYYGMNNYNTQPAVEKATEVYTCSMHPEIIRTNLEIAICGMNLVKKVTEGQSVESHSTISTTN